MVCGCMESTIRDGDSIRNASNQNCFDASLEANCRSHTTATPSRRRRAVEGRVAIGFTPAPGPPNSRTSGSPYIRCARAYTPRSPYIRCARAYTPTRRRQHGAATQYAAPSPRAHAYEPTMSTHVRPTHTRKSFTRPRMYTHPTLSTTGMGRDGHERASVVEDKPGMVRCQLLN